MLVAGAEELEVRRIDPELASLLESLAGRVTIRADDAELLVDAGLAVPA